MKMKSFMTCLAMSCMLMVCANVQAQINLGNILKNVKEKASKQTTADDGDSKKSSSVGGLLSGLGSLFNSSLMATEDKIVGTWTYTQPAVVFESDNVLSKLGGSVASSTIEKNLKEKLEKYGVKEGSVRMTFDKQGNFTQTIAGKTLKGTYTLDGTNVVLKYSGHVSQMVGHTQLSGNNLLILMDASKLLSYMKTLGSLAGNSQLKTISSLVSNVDGMLVGLKLEK